jgi:hypothetical protein
MYDASDEYDDGYDEERDDRTSTAWRPGWFSLGLGLAEVAAPGGLQPSRGRSRSVQPQRPAFVVHDRILSTRLTSDSAP